MDQPEIYLGAHFGKMILDGAEVWYMSTEKYVRAAVENFEQNLAKSNQRLPTQCKTPIRSGHWSETDTLPVIKYEGLTQYHDMVGVIRWTFELGWVDIILKAALMSMYLALPHWIHLEQVFHVFGYLKENSKKIFALIPSIQQLMSIVLLPTIGMNSTRVAKKAIPADAPIPKGNVVSTHCFVDADHAGDRYTRRSQTGVLIFMNKAPKIWYSKQHKTIETRNLSSEFIALNTATELV